MDALGFGVSRVKLSDFRHHGVNRNSSMLYSRTDPFIIRGKYNCSCAEGSQNPDKSCVPSAVSLNYSAGDLGRLNLCGQVPKRKLVFQTHCSVGGVSTNSKDALGVPSHATTVEKVGVLLLNLGGPETLHDVQPFLFNLFADPDIIRLPRLFRFLQRPLAQLISVVRAPKSKEGYAAIGGGSPLGRITNDQAHALKMALEAKKMSVNVYVGMRYWHPFTEEAIHQIKKDGVTKLVVLPLYPQFSISTSGSSIRLLQSILREDSYLARLPVSIIESWYQRQGYIKSMSSLIEKELQSFSNPKEVMIFFSAHGVPLSYVKDAGDPYRDQMEDCISLIMDELKSRGIVNDHVLAYQIF
eukprot:TRINITY_DN4260_c0_g1_i4.p1 TRINITY_DN4260_c0_g1~~TRINITY_DN4260_c0_g1_i4.p1  ORF type:complete len:355 (-),score=45.16 TRINITY_DN4260_c0_g1_i4:52-1116(-)